MYKVLPTGTNSARINSRGYVTLIRHIDKKAGKPHGSGRRKLITKTKSGSNLILV